MFCRVGHRADHKKGQPQRAALQDMRKGPAAKILRRQFHI